MIPRQNNCSPPIKMITQIVEAQPATGSPQSNRRMTIMTRKRKEKKVIRIPNQEAMLSGALEKLSLSGDPLNVFKRQPEGLEAHPAENALGEAVVFTH